MNGVAGVAAPIPVWLRHAAAIVAAALVMMAPEIIWGVSPSDSMRYDVSWTEQFVALIRTGDLYPRWLPQAWGGYGAPTFYFYPPLYFWIAAAADFLSFHSLGPEELVTAATTLVLAASGLAMRAWLGMLARPRIALPGALAYMAAPYHLFDIYQRGALAEACGYAALPVVILAVQRIALGRRVWIAAMAMAFAALLIGHLPFALLASLFAVAPFALFAASRFDRPISALADMALAILIGAGLAAAYLIPTLALTRFVSFDAAFPPFFQPQNWFFWRPGAWMDVATMHFVIALSGGLLLVGATILARRPTAEEGAFWAWIVVATVAMTAGLVPFFWSLPLLVHVQFPWRLLPVAEFAAVTAVAAARPSGGRLLLIAAVPLAFAWIVALQAMTRAPVMRARTLRELALIAAQHRDAPEYLPPGSLIPTGDNGIPEASKVRLPAMPAVVSAPDVRVEARRGIAGAMDVAVDSPHEATIAAHLFYFPHWQVTDGEGRAVPMGPAGRFRLLTWRVPVGHSLFRVRGGMAPTEREGLFVSAGAAAFLLFLSLFLGFRSRPERVR